MQAMAGMCATLRCHIIVQLFCFDSCWSSFVFAALLHGFIAPLTCSDRLLLSPLSPLFWALLITQFISLRQFAFVFLIRSYFALFITQFISLRQFACRISPSLLFCTVYYLVFFATTVCLSYSRWLLFCIVITYFLATTVCLSYFVSAATLLGITNLVAFPRQ